MQGLKIAITAAALSATAAFGEPLIMAADQQIPGVVIMKVLTDGESATLWRWKPEEDPSVRPEDARLFHAIDECKLNKGGRTILVNASHGGVGEIDVATTSIVWYAQADYGIAGPHSVTELPDGRFVIANSTGADRLELIEPHPAEGRGKAKVVQAAKLAGAHGVAWDARRKTLFALGYTNLVEYAYDSKAMKLTELRCWRYDTFLGDAWGHDLFPAGDGEYYLTNGHGIWRFSPDRGEFVAVRMIRNVKSFSRSAEYGDLLQTPTEKWWSDRLLVIGSDGITREVCRRPGARYYKARWFESELGR